MIFKTDFVNLFPYGFDVLADEGVPSKLEFQRRFKFAGGDSDLGEEGVFEALFRCGSAFGVELKHFVKQI